VAAVRLITLEPGHFHAALVQKEMVPGVAARCHVYAPLGPDLLAHLQRLAGFNARPHNPTAWEVEVHAGPRPLERLLRDRPGDVVVLSGRNRGKMARIQAAVEAGLHVLADKPWVLVPEDLTKLEAVLNVAEARRLVAYDIMTERYEATSVLQRELVQDGEVLGTAEAGSEDDPGVEMASTHFLLKQAAGGPLRRPAWFFDVHEQGEGLSDVGTHLADLVPWVLWPGQSLDWRRDLAVLSARRWPTALTRAEFERVTGEPDFPEFLRPAVRDGRLDHFGNTRVSYTLRGLHVRLDVRWDYAAPPGAGDSHFAVFRGTRSRVEVRQGEEQRYRPELYVVPADPGSPAVRAAVARRVAALQARWPGVAVEDLGGQLWLRLPEEHRPGHEAHFAEVVRQFLAYLRAPRAVPAWEKANMLAKYALTTQGVARSRSVEPRPGGGRGRPAELSA
jgi:predicted dehydrogenase